MGEIIVSKSGYVVPLSPVWASIHGGIVMKIREMKFYQDTPGKLVVLIILAPGFSQKELEDELLKEIHSRLNRNEFIVEVKFVDHLPRKARGKLGLLEQRLPIKIEYLNYFGNETGLNQPT